MNQRASDERAGRLDDRGYVKKVWKKFSAASNAVWEEGKTTPLAICKRGVNCCCTYEYNDTGDLGTGKGT